MYIVSNNKIHMTSQTSEIIVYSEAKLRPGKTTFCKMITVQCIFTYMHTYVCMFLMKICHTIQNI